MSNDTSHRLPCPGFLRNVTAGALGMAVIIACSLTMPSFGRDQQFIIGADISWINQDEAEGARYSDHGVQKDIFQIKRRLHAS